MGRRVRAHLIALTLIVGWSAAAGAQDFMYFGERGPTAWGLLDPAWATCSLGAEQSPADLRDRPLRRYRRVPVAYGETHGFIFNNGHTIEVETEGHNTLTLDGESYDLVQFHFHSPSEHRVDGTGYDMELHLVHRSAAGRLAVVGVFLRRGASSGALAPIFDELPDDVGVHHELEQAFDPSAFLPVRRSHYRLAGSLTTPPCAEGVRWLVLTEPMSVSDEHMARFNELIRFNARPVQRQVP